MALLLFLIYGVSGISRAVMLRHSITFPQIAQLLVSAALALTAVLRFATPLQKAAIAVACIAVSLASYAALLKHFDPTHDDRNYLICSSFSLALMLLGCALRLDSSWLPPILGALAMTATVLAVRTSRPGLIGHAIVYLAAAGLSSHAIEYAGHALAGVFPAQPSGLVWMILGTAVFCYAARLDRMSDRWKDRASHILSAGLATGAAITIAVVAVVWVTSLFVTPAEWHIAVVRTFTVCAVSVATAVLGSRFARAELVWISYALLTLLAAKLLVEDLHLAHAEFIAGSIFLYALTLIAVPRLSRKRSVGPVAVANTSQQIAASPGHVR
jgi:hypothetical protein